MTFTLLSREFLM